MAESRLFFAFWPDAALRATLAHATHEALRESGGRPVPVHNLHTTLLFLGSVADSRISEVVALGTCAAAEIVARTTGDHDAFSVAAFMFDRIELWEKPHVLVATTSVSSGAGHLLANELAGILQRAASCSGFTPDLKRFRPHVTLARKVHHPPRFMEMEPVTWGFADFVLVDSRTLPEGPVYTVLERFPLGSVSLERGGAGE